MRLSPATKAKIYSLSLAKWTAADIGRHLNIAEATVRKHMALSARQRNKKNSI